MTEERTPKGEKEELDEPVLNRSEEPSPADVDPRKGLDDPALIRDPEDPHPTVNPYG